MLSIALACTIGLDFNYWFLNVVLMRTIRERICDHERIEVTCFVSVLCSFGSPRNNFYL